MLFCGGAERCVFKHFLCSRNNGFGLIGKYILGGVASQLASVMQPA